MSKPQLMIAFDTTEQVECHGDACVGANGLVLAEPVLSGNLPDSFDDYPWVVMAHSPEALVDWHDRSGTLWTTGHDLEALVRLRERLPDLAWLPRAEICRPTVSYAMMRSVHGSGFTYYAPEPSTLRGLQVADGSNTSVSDWLRRAEELGFEEVWLHGRDAEVAGCGLELDLIERAHGNYHGGLWLSGGITEPRHLANLAKAGGCTCVVVPSGFIATESCAGMQVALSGADHSGTWAAHRDRRLAESA
jgi:hypothetical protein